MVAISRCEELVPRYDFSIVYAGRPLSPRPQHVRPAPVRDEEAVGRKLLSQREHRPDRHQIVALLFHRTALTPLGRRRSKSLDAIRRVSLESGKRSSPQPEEKKIPRVRTCRHGVPGRR